MDRKRILIVEDEFVTAAALKVSLEGMGYQVAGTADTGEKAIRAVAELKPDLILMDIVLKGDMTGIAAAGFIRQYHDIPIIYLTGQSDDATIACALESEPFGYIIKPFEERNLKTSILTALYKHSLETRLKASEERYRTIAELFEDGVFIVSGNYSVAYVNGSAAHILHREPVEILNKPLDEVMPEDMFRKLRKRIDETRETGRAIRGVEEFGSGNQQSWFDTVVIPLYPEDNAVPQTMAIIHDITDRILFEKKMEREGIAQLEKNMEKFQILNDQIRNPLQVITGLTMLEEGPHRNKILAQVKNIDNLVSELDRGWIESEKVRSFLIRHYRYGGDPDDKF